MGKLRCLKMLLVTTAWCLVIGASYSEAASGQKPLQRRSGVVDPELQAIYDSPEFAEAYTAAAAIYNASCPNASCPNATGLNATGPNATGLKQTYTPVIWNPHKQLLWVTNTEEQIGRYSLTFETFKKQLEAATRTRQIRTSATKAAQISEIQDQLTADNLNTLNALVKSLELAKFFASNHQPDLATLWSPWTTPETKRVLNNSEMGDVLKFLFAVDECLRRSKEFHVQYSHSSSFSWDVPRSADDKPLTPQEARFFWQWDTHKPVDEAMAALFQALSRAQTAAAAEGLFSDHVQDQATAAVPAGH